MKKIKKTCILLLWAYICMRFILNPNIFINSAQSAVQLCINTVVPTLFPFFILSNIFIHTGLSETLSKYVSIIMKPLFNIKGCGATAFILGLVSGYPIGASITAELYKKGEISKTEAERLLSFTNNAGPIFVLGAIGANMLSSQTAGFIIYTSHIIAAVVTGIIFKSYKSASVDLYSLPKHTFNNKNKLISFGTSLCESISSSVENILKVCGFIIFFSAICCTISNFPLSKYLHSIIEITGGINKICSDQTDLSLKIPIISFFLSFSGFSVFCQVHSIVSPAGLSAKTYISGKLIQASLSFFISKLLMLFIEPYPVVDVFVPIYKKISSENVWFSSLSVTFIGVCTILTLLILGWAMQERKK